MVYFRRKLVWAINIVKKIIIIEKAYNNKTLDMNKKVVVNSKNKYYPMLTCIYSN